MIAGSQGKHHAGAYIFILQLQGAYRKHLIEGLNESLERLQMDYGMVEFISHPTQRLTLS
jgi:aryl-alcohol dehydrogenase-like predicted oxidoreductase